MSKSAVVAPRAPNVRDDSKKIKRLTEAFPQVREEEAAILLQQYDGSIKLATEAIMSGERWTKVEKPKKKHVDKVEEVAVVETRRPRDRDRDQERPRPQRKPDNKQQEKNAASAAVASKDETPVASQPTVTQTEVRSNPWVKGKGLSFADMVKKKEREAEEAEKARVEAAAKAAAEAAAEEARKIAAAQEAAAAAAAAAARKPAPRTKAASSDAAVSSNNHVSDAAPVAHDAAPANAEGSPKPARRERKPRDEASRSGVPTAGTSAAAVAPPPPASVAAVAPAAPAPLPQPKPQVVKYVLEFDRVEHSVALPHHVEDLANRFRGTWTFSGTQGRAPTPPPPPPAPTPQPAPQAPLTQSQNFMFTQQPSRPAWPTPEPTSQPQRMSTAASQGWDSHNTASWGRNFMQYQSYQQPTYPPRTSTGFGSRYGSAQPHQHSGHHHGIAHHRMHPAEHVASDVAYSAIREEVPSHRLNPGVW